MNETWGYQHWWKARIALPILDLNLSFLASGMHLSDILTGNQMVEHLLRDIAYSIPCLLACWHDRVAEKPVFLTEIEEQMMVKSPLFLLVKPSSTFFWLLYNSCLHFGKLILFQLHPHILLVQSSQFPDWGDWLSQELILVPHISHNLPMLMIVYYITKLGLRNKIRGIPKYVLG